LTTDITDAGGGWVTITVTLKVAEATFGDETVTVPEKVPLPSEDNAVGLRLIVSVVGVLPAIVPDGGEMVIRFAGVALVVGVNVAVNGTLVPPVAVNCTV
jgi:hypothetical protein